MTKLVAIVKREYTQRVRAKMFIVTTILLPVAMSLFAIVPLLVFSIEGGTPLRLVVVDGTGKVVDRIKTALIDGDEPATDSNSGQVSRSEVEKAAAQRFAVESMSTPGLSATEINRELESRLIAKEIDAFLILPADLLQGGKALFYRRNTGDLMATRRVQEALNKAVREQRLINANVDQQTLRALERSVDFETTKITQAGQEKDSGSGFALIFAVGLVMYLTVLLYGQVVLGAVIEEKETRIAEVLFSSVRPFTLMMGKLLGVSLVALTQLAIWGIAFAILSAYGVSLLAMKGFPVSIPSVPLIFYVYFLLFFLLGYFVYSTMYALVGSIVTTPQEGGQMAMPIVLVLVVGFYFFLPVTRSPDSNFAFWISLVPFFAPVTMLVRIVTQTPPFWQIALSLLIGFTTVGLLTWLAARIYRIGMLMYGKRASIPEIVRWVRQS